MNRFSVRHWCFHAESQTDDQLARVTKTLMQLKRHIDENASLTSSDHWLTGLFADQDDQLLEALLCLLCVVGGCRKRYVNYFITVVLYLSSLLKNHLAVETQHVAKMPVPTGLGAISKH